MQEQIEEQPRIEWIILADAAEISDTKLYMLGGAWDRIPASKNPNDVRSFAIAVSVVIPWHETNKRHAFTLQIVDEDGKSVMFKAEGELIVGRPPTAVPGQVLRTPMVIKIIAPLEKVGTYAVIGFLNGKERARTAFHVDSVPGATPKPPAITPGT
jgi:hypothetical protein